MVAFVVLLVAIWGGGFLWFKGGLGPGSDKGAAASSSPEGTAQPGTSAAPGASAVPAAGVTYTGKVSRREEKKAVDITPTEPRPKPIAMPPVASFTMATFNLLGSSHSKSGGSSSRF